MIKVKPSAPRNKIIICCCKDKLEEARSFQNKMPPSFKHVRWAGWGTFYEEARGFDGWPHKNYESSLMTIME